MDHRADHDGLGLPHHAGQAAHRQAHLQVFVAVEHHHLVGLVGTQGEDAHAVTRPVVLLLLVGIQCADRAQVLQPHPGHHTVAQRHQTIDPGRGAGRRIQKIGQCRVRGVWHLHAVGIEKIGPRQQVAQGAGGRNLTGCGGAHASSRDQTIRCKRNRDSPEGRKVTFMAG